MTVPARAGDRHAYSVFGLCLASTGELPGLTRAHGAGEPDVFVELQATAPLHDLAATRSTEALYLSPERDETGRPTVVVERLGAGGLVRMRYVDGIEFVIDGGGRHIWATWPEPWTVDDVATYLLGPVLAFTLRRRGVTCLHASAVAVDGVAIAFAGPAGAGKSTMAASLARRGHPVLADDIVALDGDGADLLVQPGPSRIRLWPESVAALYGSAEALPRLTPTWDKRFLDATRDGCRFQERPLPLAAVYVLGDRGPHPVLPRVEPLSAAAGLVALLANTQASHLVDDRCRADEFHCLGRVAASVRVCRLTPHDDVTRLAALCDAVVEDVLGSAVRV